MATLTNMDEFFRPEAQRMLETVRNYVLHAPEFAAFEACQNWSVVYVLISRSSPENLWTIVEECFGNDHTIGQQANRYLELSRSSTRFYSGIKATAIHLLWQESNSWNFKK